MLARYYNVRKWPCAYLVSKDGYVLASVDFEEKPECTFEEYSAKMKDAGQEALKTKSLVEKVENSSGIEKAQAINELVENTSQEHCFLLKDLIQEFIVLDKQDSTGLLGAYEVRNAYNKSLEAFAEGKDPAEPFEQIAEKTSLSDLQRQEAMYMAAYVLVNLPDIDFERVQQCLEKAYSIKTEGGYSEEILKALETVRKFSAMKKARRAKSSGFSGCSFAGAIGNCAGSYCSFNSFFCHGKRIFSVNKLRVRLLRGKQDKRAIRVWNLLKNKDRLINTLLVGNNIVNIALSAVFTFIAVGLFGSAGIGLATFVVTILLLVFGEITPKIIATHHPEAVAFFFSFFVQIIETLLFPLVMVFTSFSRLVLKVFKINVKPKKVSYTEEEIKTFLDVGCEQGILKVNEKT